MFRSALAVAFLFAVSVSHTSADGLVPCSNNPDDPTTSCQSCHLVDLTNNIVTWLAVVMGTIATLLFLYAGVRLLISVGNPQGVKAAKTLIHDTIVGFIIVLGCWFIVSFIMQALLPDDGEVFNLGLWNGIQCVAQPVITPLDPVFDMITGGVWQGLGPDTPNTVQSQCEATGIDSTGNLAYDCSSRVTQCESAGGTPTLSAAGDRVTCGSISGGTVDTSGLGQCSNGNTACSVQALVNAGLTQQQANIMSCIAMTESSGIANTPRYNVTHPGSNSSACGTFQIVGSTWRNNASGECSDHVANCQNASCNIQVMKELVRKNGYRDWTCPGCNNKASGCVSRYGG